jgi:hypothetical protein
MGRFRVSIRGLVCLAFQEAHRRRVDPRSTDLQLPSLSGTSLSLVSDSARSQQSTTRRSAFGRNMPSGFSRVASKRCANSGFKSLHQNTTNGLSYSYDPASSSTTLSSGLREATSTRTFVNIFMKPEDGTCHTMTSRRKRAKTIRGRRGGGSRRRVNASGVILCLSCLIVHRVGQ